MNSYIESVLQKLLTPDSAIIKQATKQLLEYFVSDKCVLGLFEVLKTSQNPQNLCSHFVEKKAKNWKIFQDNEKTIVKSEIIDVLVKEPEETVRKQIMWLIASIYKYSLKTNQEWPELLKFMNDLIISPTPEQHLSGVFMLSILNEESAEQLKPHFLNLFKIFSTILTDLNNLKAAYYVISSLKCIIPFTNEDEITGLTNLLPLAVNAAIKVIKTDQQEETVSTIFDFFQSLIEYDIPMVSSYIKNLTEMTLEFISDTTLLNPTRICAMNYLNVLIETHKTNLIKNEMIRPIVNAVFTIMCQSNDPLQTKSDIEIDMLEDGDHDDENIDDTENIFTASTQVLDFCALYFPAKKLIKILIDYVSPTITSEDPLHRRAALAALAITSEGCADYYRNHYLEVLTDVCVKGMQDSDASVVQLSYFALCQFSEYLQPNLSQFSGRIMKLLIENIESKIELRSVSRLTVRFYDALQSFCENLGDDLEEYLPTLMSKLMTLEVQSNSSLKLQRLIISTFSSIVCSVKSKFNPYFDFAVNMIKPYLSYNQLQSKHNDSKMLQIECIDLMGVFAKFIGKEKFTDALIENCLTFVQNALVNENDPEIRSAAYDLLAGLTSKLKEQLPLKSIMPQIIETLKNEEGINVIDSDNKQSDVFSAFDEIDLQDEDLDDEEDDEDEDEDDQTTEDSQKLIVENEYVAEKLSAIICLQEILKYVNPQIFDYYNDCFNELKNLLNFVHLNIRKESYLAVAYLISYYHDYCISNLHQANDAQKETIIKTFNSNLKEFNTKSVKAIKMDANRQLVMSVFDSIRLLLSRCATYVKTNLKDLAQPLESYGNLIIETFENKIYCQMVNNDESPNVEDDEAEYDYMLKEYAGDVIPSLALCLNDEMFDNYFEKVLVYLFRLLNKSESSPAEKSFVVGVIGETVANLEFVQPKRAQQLFKEFYKYINDSEDEIRSNTIYTVGVLCTQSRNALAQFYPQIINDIYSILKKEKNKQTLDNICGTLCRMFLCCVSSNLQAFDYELLIKTIFDLTPLKVDFNEYHTLYTFISQTISNKLLINHYQKIVELSGHIMSNSHEEEFKPGTKEMAVQFLKYVDQNYKEELNILLGEIKTDLANTIRICLAQN